MLRLATLLGVVCVLLAMTPSTACAQGQSAVYQVGVSKVDVTPDYPIRLNGFGFRREESEGVNQRIWVKALAIAQGEGQPVVLLTLDSLGIRLPMLDKVAARLKERTELPRARIVLSFSHSHTTPKVNGASDNIFSQAIPAAHQKHIDRYTRELTDRIERAALAAIENRKPSRLSWSVGKVTFAKNRRTAGGPVDHDLPMLAVKSLDGNVRAIYVSYACHCVTLSDNKIGGDWAGYAQEMIERRFPGTVALVAIGAGSDQNPQSGVQGGKTEIAAAQGDQIAHEVARLLKAPLNALNAKPAAQLQRIDLPLNPLPTREQFEQMAAKGGPAGYNASTKLARLDRGDKLLTKIDYPIQTITFGDELAMVFLAGEVCVDYSLRLKRELNRERIWINAYSNDFCSYIPSERLAKEGGYGGGSEIPYFALPTTLKAGLEQLIIDEVRKQVPASYRVKPGTQGVPPKSPDESLRSMKTHDDLKIDLVAAEPLIADPVAIDFGPDGRLWVTEMSDYTRATDEEFQPNGRIRVLSDNNDDGRFDKSTVFLDGLRFPTDIKLWRDGVLVCDAPDILYAEDTTGDGRANVRKVLFSGFETKNPHARVNSLRLGLDNWIYGSGGLFGGQITSFSGKTANCTGRDFRLNPDTGDIEAVTGRTQQGRIRNDWGDWFGCTNGSLFLHYPLVDRYVRRNPQFAPPGSVVSVPADANAATLFPIGELVRFKLSGPAGRPTSVCGAAIYRDELLGQAFAGNGFSCEPVNQLVHRLVLSRRGGTFAGTRAPEEQTSQFLASTDRWFRPVQVRTGPDGALWVVDMYRYVIEHPRWIPPEVVAQLDTFAGQSRGRIYRIFPKRQPPRPAKRFDQLATAQLVAELDSPNGTQRDLVQQLLTWKSDQSAQQPLEQLAEHGEVPAGRLHAICTLDGLNALGDDVVLHALSDEHPEVRRHAIRLAEGRLNES
ncbi:MAG: dehydrogenase, partial [Planctomycetaceae bacterium]|nr:dehydrogenase [Planctomycetaceae bacterium]